MRRKESIRAWPWLLILVLYLAAATALLGGFLWQVLH